jgi:hypothetical protein
MRVFASIREEIYEYLSKLHAAKDKQKWGFLYLVKASFLGFVDFAKIWKNRIAWTFQRLMRKYHASDIDLRQFDLHIARVLLPKLEAFRNQNLNVSPTKDMKEWFIILDEIIYALRWNIYANWERDTKRERAFYLRYFGQDVPNLDYLHYYDSELVKKAADRAQKGFELFGKYFTGLWDL